MAGPPEHIEPSALWTLITQIPRPHREVDFPRKLPGTDTAACKVAIWPLTQEEQMICNAEADRFTKQVLKDAQKKGEEHLGYNHIYSNEVGVQVLFRACRQPGGKPENLAKPFFPSTKAMRAELTHDEVSTLFELYCAVQLEVGPIVAYLSEEELRAWTHRLQEGGEAIPFEFLAPQAKRQLLLFMASRLVSFWTGTSSPGSQPENGNASNADPLEAPPDPEPLEIPNE